MVVKVRYVDASFILPDGSVIGSCPCAVNMRNGVVYVNTSVWGRYDNFEQKFLIMHEVGHYVLDTDSEYEADAYALQKVFNTAPRSLRRSLQTLCKIGVIDPNRLNMLYVEALKLDTSYGNQAAAIELQNICNENNIFSNNKKSKIMTKNRGPETYPQKTGIVPDYKIIRRIDGSRGHGQNGIHIGDWYLSITNILLAIIVVILWAKN